MKENIPRSRNLGRVFEQFTSTLVKKEKLITMGDIPAALLATNENADFAALKEEIGVTPDGYIYGVGAGNVFSLGLLFDYEVVPKAILSVDILPDAVLSGRVVVDLMRLSDNFDSFQNNLRSREVLDATVSRIIQSETSSELQEVFEKLDKIRIFDLLEEATRQVPEDDIVQFTRYKDNISVVAAIRKNWTVLKQLAEECNIGFGLAGYYQPEVINHITSLPDYARYRNVIYSSNLIDYPDVALDQNSPDPRWMNFKRVLNPLDSSNNIFIFTTIESDLNLYATQGISEQAPEGFWF